MPTLLPFFFFLQFHCFVAAVAAALVTAATFASLRSFSSRVFLFLCVAAPPSPPLPYLLSFLCACHTHIRSFVRSFQMDEGEGEEGEPGASIS